MIFRVALLLYRNNFDMQEQEKREIIIVLLKYSLK